MSRSGYSDDCENVGLWRGAVERATFGKRGQAFLIELAAALDAMPDKRLITDELVADGAYCTLGVIGAARGLDMKVVEVADTEAVGKMFKIAPALAAQIVYENDECNHWASTESPEKRWTRMRQWVADQIPAEAAA